MNAQNRIRELMSEHHWTEYRLAKECGLSQATISNLFRRNNSPSLSTLETICNAFGISLSQFFAESDEPVSLTSEQKELFDAWISLTDDQKKVILNLIHVMK